MKLVKKDSGVYHAVIRKADGKRATISTKQTDRQAAAKVVKDANLEQIELAARSGMINHQAIGLLMTGKKSTAAGAAQEYLTWLGNTGRSPRTIEHFGSMLRVFLNQAKLDKAPVISITEVQVNAWVNRPGDYALNTRRGFLQVVTKFLDFCSAKGFCLGNAARLVRINFDAMTHKQKEPAVREVFTEEEICRLLKSNPPGTFWHSAIAIGRYTGLRMIDVCNLEWDSFSKPGKMAVWTKKRDRRVELPMSPQALTDAVASIPIVDQQYCFPAERAKFNNLKRRNYFAIRFRALVKKIGVTTKTFHCLRHTYATECFKAGVPTPHISERLGHGSTATTEIYIPKPDGEQPVP